MEFPGIGGISSMGDNQLESMDTTNMTGRGSFIHMNLDAVFCLALAIGCRFSISCGFRLQAARGVEPLNSRGY